MKIETRDDLDRIAGIWCDRIKKSEEREEAWMKTAEAAENAFAAGVLDNNGAEPPRFNILHSNIETMTSAVYNSTPTPDVRPRHNRDDEVARAVSTLIEEAIATQVDDARMDKEVEAAAQDGLLAGRGVVRVRFDADTVEAIDEFGQPYEDMQNERVIYEVVSWRDYREGPAKRWSDVPWVAYRHFISTDEKERLEDPEFAAHYADENQEPQREETDQEVWECWCKDSGRVYWVIEASRRLIAVMDDPLGLPGFFPQPEPIQPITLTGRRMPVCPYAVYKDLAKEVDDLTVRIDAIVDGLRVRGIIGVGAEELERLAMAGDNELVAAGDLEALAAMGGIEKAIAWWPVEKAILVLRELYAAREASKQTIYEVTGISDIVRGASNSGETATAQQIKTQWGGLRIRKAQRAIQRHVRDLFVLSAEIISLHFGAATLAKIGGQQPEEVMAEFSQALDHYRIDIESDSTIRADLTRARGEMAEFLNGTAQYLSTMAPVVQQSPEAAEPVLTLYASFARQFSLGREAEDALQRMVTSAREASTGEQAQQMRQQAAQMQQQAAQLDMQAKQVEIEAKQAETAGKAEERQIKAMDVQNRAIIDAQRVGLDRDKLILEERKAEVNAVTRGVEIEMEQDQRRPVAIGEV